MKMIIQQTTDLGDDALKNPKKYNAFLGVSIMHRFFSKKNMRYYFEWCSQQFNEFIVLLMDDPDQHNFMVFKKMSEEKALEQARKISDELKSGYEKIIRGINSTNIKILQFRDFINDTKYTSILNTIRGGVEVNSAFEKDLECLMDMGIGGKIQELSLPDFELQNIRKKLRNYIIEELAAIIFLTESGHPIELDPTIEFTTKTKLYNGDFSELSQQLQLTERGHIYIHPEGIQKSTY